MASWARVAGACAQATRSLLRQEGQLARAAQQGGQQSRGFAAGRFDDLPTHAEAQKVAPVGRPAATHHRPAEAFLTARAFP